MKYVYYMLNLETQEQVQDVFTTSYHSLMFLDAFSLQHLQQSQKTC